METEIINQPMIVLMLSSREAKAALDDPTQLQAAIRREWLTAQGITSLALPAPASNGHDKPRKLVRKMGGAKRSKPAPAESSRKRASGMRECRVCGRAFVTAGFLARHMRQVHPDDLTLAEREDDDE